MCPDCEKQQTLCAVCEYIVNEFLVIPKGGFQYGTSRNEDGNEREQRADNSGPTRTGGSTTSGRSYIHSECPIGWQTKPND
jgi:hypothetical protein